MSIIGAALAFGPRNDIGVTGVGPSVGYFADEILSSLFRHPGYPSLLDKGSRDAGEPEHAAGEAVTDYLAMHEALDAFGDSLLDPLFASRLDDAAIRAASLAGLAGKAVKVPRCVAVIVASSARTGSLITFGGGPRLGVAYADAVDNLRAHPMLPALVEQRPATPEESFAGSRWIDLLLRQTAVDLELDR